MMVEQYSVPEGPLYPMNSYGPGFAPYQQPFGSDLVKAEEKMGELLIQAYHADTPPGRYKGLFTFDWSMEFGGCWLDHVDSMDDPTGSMAPSSMYDFNILTPDMTPPHQNVNQSDCMNEINDVLSSLSSHSSLSDLPFGGDGLDSMLMPTYSPTFPIMSTSSPPPIIHPHTQPPASPAATATPNNTAKRESSSSPACSKSDNVKGKHKLPVSSASNGTKRRRPTEPRKQRKREQNKVAALKYRSRKKEEKLNLGEQQAQLEKENAALQEQVKAAEEEIAYLKSVLHEVCTSANNTKK